MPPLDGHRSRTPVFHSQLAEDFVEVVLHCVGADPKDDSDLLVRFALANPFGDLLLARTEMILAKRALVFTLFVDEQEKTACMGMAAKAHCQLTKLRSRTSIPAEISNSLRRASAKPLNYEIMERSGQPASRLGLAPHVARNQAPCRFTAISHLSICVQENMASTKNAFDRFKNAGFVGGLEQPIHLDVKSDDPHALARHEKLEQPCLK